MDHNSIRSGRNYSIRELQLHHLDYPLTSIPLARYEIVDATNYSDMAKKNFLCNTQYEKFNVSTLCCFAVLNFSRVAVHIFS